MRETVYTHANPSPRFLELARVYREVHERGLPGEGITAADLFAGRSLRDHIPRVKALIDATGARSIIDYGSGKGVLYAERNIELRDGRTVTSVQDYWGVDAIRCFDPGVPEFAVLPSEPADGVICTDVLEHVPEEDIPWMLAEFFRLASRFVYANVASYPATKTLPNGWNAHVTVRPPAWWEERIRYAARGWAGTYEFQVREHRNTPRLLRKLTGMSKWKVSSIGWRGKGHTEVPRAS